MWAALCEIISISHRQTAAYHPEANGAIERLHCRLKEALLVWAAVATLADESLWVLLSLRSQPREDIGFSPAEAVYGVPVVLPNEFLQVEEFTVDQIVNKFSKIIDTPAFSLPSKHNSRKHLLSSCMPPWSGCASAESSLPCSGVIPNEVSHF